jgi:hypothetical protein
MHHVQGLHAIVALSVLPMLSIHVMCTLCSLLWTSSNDVLRRLIQMKVWSVQRPIGQTCW